MLFSHLSLLLSASAITQAANPWIVPGTPWLSSSGTKIDAHGGMILQQGDTFYWVGQATSHNIQPYMYSSKNLLDWTPSANPQNAIQYLWRPKITKLNGNGAFWMYGQVDRNVQALKSSKVNDNYAVVGNKVTLPPNAYTYSDTGFFVDSDGTSYLLASADHNNVQINRINTDGSVGDRVNVLKKGAYEAPGILKVGGIYYLIVSGKTGYRSNPNQMFWTDKIVGGTWNGPYPIAPEAENTYNSQNTFELTIAGSKRTTYIYMGDSWEAKGGPDSNYVWLPMNVDTSKKTVTLEYHAQWKIDVATGEISFPSKKRRYEVEGANVAGTAKTRRGLGNVGLHEPLTFTNVTGLGGSQWVQLHYRVLNRAAAGEAYVSVNSGPPVNVSSLNHRAGLHGVVPVLLDLEKGAENTIEFGTSGDGAAIVVDGIEVVED